MRAFKVTGTFAMGRKDKQPFTKYVAAEDETSAREQTLSLFGSKHRTNRRRISITAVVPAQADEIDDPRVLARVKG
jgi:ribosomal protein L20A (L18A)